VERSGSSLRSCIILPSRSRALDGRLKQKAVHQAWEGGGVRDGIGVGFHTGAAGQEGIFSSPMRMGMQR
jgi:hypothetical protein